MFWGIKVCLEYKQTFKDNSVTHIDYTAHNNEWDF